MYFSSVIKKAFLLGSAALLLLCSSCQSVAPYQRAYLNDALMNSGDSDGSDLEISTFNYREGGLNGGGQKGRGGCGCN